MTLDQQTPKEYQLPLQRQIAIVNKLKHKMEKALTEKASEDEKNLTYIEFYSQTLAATYNTSLEIVKTYIIISATAIAFLLQINPKQLILKLIVLLAILLFFLCCLISTKIYRVNKYYLLALLNGKNEDQISLNSKIKVYSKLNQFSFFSALILCITYAVSNIFMYNI